jgi:hypothetical protein
MVLKEIVYENTVKHLQFHDEAVITGWRNTLDPKNAFTISIPIE